ncbi:MAG: outer membrane beta-barrel protein [Sulfurimonadaceae bacterium]|jgi:opacity protein-like surface antigen|nr:outer membrane beta-barrel protein [Sulfurimonadaceae bacterium]
MRLLLWLLLILTLSTSAIANSKITSYIFLGGHSSKIMDNNAQFYTIGYGWDRTFENRLYVGGTFAFNFGSIDMRDEITLRTKSETITGYDVDMRLGYSLERVDIFSIVGVAAQGFNNTTAYGFGYGAGISWRIDERWSLGTEYKIHRMTSNKLPGKYDYDVFVMRLGFRF